ncbi:Conserved oligomeric Golgi complex subunit 5 [Nakaseomyces bracarensis]|uniref:Conserved oligomeric Golgi complex subunit 5 n=1 Tax=Nakaseomyces bracarensis TaxID=273131 RepID=A0ABR4NRI1_9SACH
MIDVNFKDFEELREPGFDATRYTNDLLKTMNTDSSTLEIGATKKKIQYDAAELSSRYEQFLKRNSSIVLEKFYNDKVTNETISSGLKPSLEYLDVSYKRLMEQVLVPYERAQKLQSVLSNVHQTSTLLRDVLMFLHLTQQIVNFVPLQNESKLTVGALSKLASLHYQIQVNQSQNANLKSLKFVKEMESSTLAPRRKSLLGHLVITISRECLNSSKLRNNQDDIKALIYALYSVSEQEFYTTIQKVILTNATNSSRILSKSINAIKTFPSLFDDVVTKGHDIAHIEKILQSIKTDNSNLLVQFLRLTRPKSTTPRDLYWGRISSSFKLELKTAIDRGGPVGKQLIGKQDAIEDWIKSAFEKYVEIEPDYSTNIEYMSKIF